MRIAGRTGPSTNSTIGRRSAAPHKFTWTKRLALSIDRPSDARSSLAQIERAEKHTFEPIAIAKPRRLNDASAIDEMETPATMGRSERATGRLGDSARRKQTVRSIVAIGSPAFTVSTNDAFTAPNEPFVRQNYSSMTSD